MSLRPGPSAASGAPLAAAIACVTLALGACNLDFSNRAEAHDQWQRHYTLAQGGTFEIHNTNGAIHIEPGAGDAVEVTADRSVKASDDAAAKDALAHMEIQETVSPGQITLDNTSGGAGLSLMGLSRRIDYRVKLPAWANVTLRSTNGQIDVAGPRLTGIFRASATNGRITATGLENSAVVEATNGEVRIEVNRLGEDGLSCQTTNGPIAVTVPASVNARLSARVANGGISTEGLNLTVAEQSRRRLDGTLGEGGPLIRLETTNGPVSIKGK